MLSEVRTDRAAVPLGPYSQGRVAGGVLYVSGQGPIAPDGTVLGETFEEQSTATLDSLKAIVEAAGAGMKDVVKVNVYLANMGDWRRLNEVYRRYFREPYPVRTTVQAGLMGILIEVDAIAHLP